MKAIIFTLTLLFSSTLIAGPFTIYSTKQGLLNNNVNCIEQGDNFVWIGTNSGINRIITDNDAIVKFSPRGTSVPVLSLKNDGDFIWVGLKGKGVYKMPKSNYKFIGFRKDILGDKDILSIDKEGNTLTVITATAEYSFDLKSNKYTSKASSTISAELEIKTGDKVIKNFKNQISRYNTVTKSYRSFNHKATVNDYLTWGDRLLIASSNGLLLYNEQADTIKFAKPFFKLNTFKINGADTNEVLDGSLPWDDYIFSYEFTFTELGEPENITLNYTLKHNNAKPIQLSSRAIDPLILKGLSHGDYTIEVKATNSLNVSSSNSLTYSFSIQNPMNDTILQVVFWGICILIFTIIVVLLTRLKFKKDIKLLENALLEKTNELNGLKNKNYGLVDEDEVAL